MTAASDRHRRISEIFLATCDLPPDQQSARLDRECGEDPDLRAAVDRLLRSHSQRSAFLDADRIPAPPRPPIELPPTPIALIGRRIGPFHLVRVMASGGMGTVFEALQDRPQRSVAVKILRRGLFSAEAQRRFEYESQILARLRHPGVAQVFEAGTWDDPDDPGSVLPWFAMELVAGARPITKFCEEGVVPLRPRLALFLQVCDAVHHGHQRGVIHRDLKPGNLLVDEAGRVKVIDFGVARCTDADVVATTVHTELGQLLGTLQYMSPEQCAGDPGEVDVRSDVYSLGVVLFELVTGAPPYVIEGLALAQVIERIRDGVPARPRSLREGVAVDLETIVLKALEKDPGRRYPSVLALAQDLERFLRHEPIEARPPSFGYRVGKFVRRHRAAAAAASLAIASLAVGLLLAIQGGIKAAHGRDQALGALDESEAVTAFLEDLLASANPEEFGKDVPVRAVLDAACARIDRFADRPRVQARLLHALGRTRLALGDPPAAAELLGRSAALREKWDGAAAHTTLEARHDLSIALKFAGRHAEALALVEEVMRAPEIEGDPASKLALLARAQRGSVLVQLGRFEEARSDLEAALAGCRTVFGPEDRETLVIENNFANCLSELGQVEQAAAIFARIADLRRERRGPEDPQTLAALANLATQMGKLRKWDEAFALAEPLLATQERVLGPKSNATLNTLFLVGRLHGELGRGDAQLECLTEHYARTLDAFGPDAELTIESGAGLGCALLDAGRTKEAAERLEGALDAARRAWPADHPDLLLATNNLATAYLALGRFADSERLAREALERMERVFGHDDDRTLTCRSNLGTSIYRQMRFDEARPILEQCLARRRAQPGGADDPATCMLAMNLGMLCSEQGDAARGEDLLRETAATLERVRGPDHQETAKARFNLALVLERRGIEDESMDVLADSIARLRRAYPQGHPELQFMIYVAAKRFADHRRDEAAAALFEEIVGWGRARGRLGEASAGKFLDQLIAVLARLDRHERIAELEAERKAAMAAASSADGK